MAKGIKVPVQVSRTGGIAWVEADDHKRQVIMLALSSGENANAFQQNVNLGDDMIFGADSPRFRSGILRRLDGIFRTFEEQKLFRLMRETIEWENDLEAGELTLSFSYVDIESDEVKEFRKPYTVRA